MGIPLHEPVITAADEQSVLASLRSQWVSTGGPYITQFEREMAQYAGFKYAVAVSNGTAGLVLALEVVKRSRHVTGGFHVLVPTLSFAATWNSVIEAGGHPVPVDTEKDCVGISLQTIQNVLLENFQQESGRLLHKVTRLPLIAILPAHILGWAYDLDQISTFCAEHSLDLIEDAAESLGTRYLDGKHVGAHGVCSVLSFNGNKILTTGGGGMLMTNNESIASRARHLSTTAKTDGLRFMHDEPGFNFRMVNVLAALGVSQLSRLDENLKRKRYIANLYADRLGQAKLKLYAQTNCHGNCWINTVVLPSYEIRETVLQHLQENGIDSRPLWAPFHRLPYCPSQNPAAFPNAEEMWKTCLSVPSSPQLKDEQIEQICSLIVKAVTKGNH